MQKTLLVRQLPLVFIPTCRLLLTNSWVFAEVYGNYLQHGMSLWLQECSVIRPGSNNRKIICRIYLKLYCSQMGVASSSGCSTGTKTFQNKEIQKKKTLQLQFIVMVVSPVIKIGIKITELLVAECSHVPVLMLHTSDSCSMMVIGSVCLLIHTPAQMYFGPRCQNTPAVWSTHMWHWVT